MKRFARSVYSLAILFFLLFGFITETHAATIYMLPTGGTLKVGQSIDVEVRVDSGDKSFNGIEGTLKFPADKLEVTEVDSSPASSVIVFWLKQPEYSNTEGTVSFAGGTAEGISGASVPILKVTLRAKASGDADVVLGDASVSASDGSGTNILTLINISRLTIKPGDATTSSSSKAPPPEQKPVAVVPAPVQISRAPTEAKVVPATPKVSIKLYPETSEWSNQSADFATEWEELPGDVSAVATALTKDPKTIPDKSEGLFESKTWPALGDGVWYVHVRFKNSVGWGPVAHRKISIDTHPPLPLNAKILEGASSDNPSPTIEFSSSDGLSGMKGYTVVIDGGEPVSLPFASSTEVYKTPVLSLGAHKIVIRASDNANNRIEQTLSYEALPIESPKIGSVPSSLFSDAPDFLARGTGIPGTQVVISLVVDGLVVGTETTQVDADGDWVFSFARQLKNGTYIVRVIARDSRGAESLAVESTPIVVKTRPILQIGSYGLDLAGVVIMLVLILIVGFFSGLFYVRREREMISMRVGFTQSESAKMFAMLKKDVDALKGTKHDSPHIKSLQESIEKMEVYLHRGIEKIKK